MCCGKKNIKSRLRMTKSGIKKRRMSQSDPFSSPQGEPRQDSNLQLPKNQEESINPSIFPPYDVQKSQPE